MPRIKVGRGEFRVLPRKYVILAMTWYSKGAQMILHRLAISAYLLNHIFRYKYDIPPVYSVELMQDVNALLDDGLLTLIEVDGLTGVRVTDSGRRVIGELMRMKGEYVLVNDYLIMRICDLFNEIFKAVSIHQDMPTVALLGVAYRDLSLRLKGLDERLLAGLAKELKDICECSLG